MNRRLCRRKLLQGLGACPGLALAAGVLGSLTAVPRLAGAVAEPPEVPFVPTPHEVVTHMLEMARVDSRDVVYDLGSGDGRIAIAAARRGARAKGIEINSKLVSEARNNARAAGVGSRVEFLQADLFAYDLSEATVITLYLLPRINLKLRPRLLALAPGTRIVSHAFDMGDWKPDRTDVIRATEIHLWTVPPHGTVAAHDAEQPNP